MALTIIRTATGATIDTSYSSLSANLASSLSSSFVVPSGVSRVAHASVSVATDDVTETCTVCRLSGNAMKDGEQFVNGPGMNTIGTSTGAFNGTTEHDVDFKITPGNSLEIAMGATVSITGEVSVILTLV